MCCVTLLPLPRYRSSRASSSTRSRMCLAEAEIYLNRTDSRLREGFAEKWDPFCAAPAPCCWLCSPSSQLALMTTRWAGP